MTSLHAARRAVSHRYLLPAALGLALAAALPAKADSVTDWNGTYRLRAGATETARESSRFRAVKESRVLPSADPPFSLGERPGKTGREPRCSASTMSPPRKA